MLSDIRGKDKGSTIINNTKYFFKRNDAFVELLAEKIADLFGFNHAHYIPVTVDGLNYYISEDLNERGFFTTADDLGINSNNIHDIRDYVLTLFPNEFDRLMDDIIKMYFMDLLILNIDRNVSNWGFLTMKGHTNICLLDNDLSFVYYNSCMSSTYNPKMDSYIELQNIFDFFPREYVDMFLEMYELLDPNKLYELIKETERDFGIELPNKNNYMSRFITLRKSVEELRTTKNKAILRK